MSTVTSRTTTAADMNRVLEADERAARKELARLQAEQAAIDAATLAEQAAEQARVDAAEGDRAAYLAREARAKELKVEIAAAERNTEAAALVAAQRAFDTGPVGAGLLAQMADAHAEAKLGAAVHGVDSARASWRRQLGGLTPPPAELWRQTGALTYDVTAFGLTWVLHLAPGSPDLDQLILALSGVPGYSGPAMPTVAAATDLGALLASYPSLASHVEASVRTDG